MEMEATMLAAIGSLAKSADDASEGTTSDVARRLDLAEQLKMVAQQIIDVTTESLVDRMEEPTLALAGVGLFHKKPRKRSVWRDTDSSDRFRRDVFHAVESEAQVVGLDRSTGEVDPKVKAAVRQATDLLDESLPSFSGVKAKAWKRLGLDEDDYRRVEWTTGIQVERGIEVAP